MQELVRDDGVFALTVLGAAIEQYRREGKTPRELLALVEELTRLQARLYTHLKAGSVSGDEPPSPPAEWAVVAIQQSANTAAAHSDKGAAGLRRFAACVGKFDSDDLQRAFHGDESTLSEMAGAADISPVVAAFIVRAALQPFYAWRFGAASAASGDPAFPARLLCPACGGRPMMGKHIEPDGHRFLRCGVCANEWAYPRLACPSCGEDRQDRLESFFVNGDEGHRVYVCASCKRFTKISDERLLGGRVYLPLEDIVTLHLDDLARERGYTPVSDEEAGGQVQGNRILQ